MVTPSPMPPMQTAKSSGQMQAQPVASNKTGSSTDLRPSSAAHPMIVSTVADHPNLLTSTSSPLPGQPLESAQTTPQRPATNTTAAADQYTPTSARPSPAVQASPQITKITNSITHLSSQILTTQTLLDTTLSTLASIPSQSATTNTTTTTETPTAEAIVQRHIRLLHQYNEIKDVGQGLLGLIADARGVRLVDVMDEFGVSGTD